MLVWIDDVYFTNFRSTRALAAPAQFQTAQVAGYRGMCVFYTGRDILCSVSLNLPRVSFS